jgi:hypothetical protein
MLKKIFYTVLFVALAVGTVYSWQKVDFSRKAIMFFQVVFGDENAMRGPGGQPPMGDNRGGDMSRPEPPNGQAMGPDSQEGRSGPPVMAEDGERGAPPQFGERGNPGERPAEGGGPGGHGGPGGYISLRNVAKYTVIMAFFVMLTRLLDQLALRLKRSRKPA